MSDLGDVLPSYVELFGPHAAHNLLDDDKKEDLLIPEEEPPCTIHYVSTTDTLSGIAIKYNVKVMNVHLV
jgi:LysM repeat protein